MLAREIDLICRRRHRDRVLVPLHHAKKLRACVRVHGGDDCGGCGDGGCGGGDYVVAVPERQQRRLKACYQAVDLVLCQHENLAAALAALQPAWVYARPECLKCHAPRDHDYDIRRAIKN